jgi:hypothetical protein
MVTTAVVTVKETGEVDVAPVVLIAPSLFQLLPHPLLVLTYPSTLPRIVGDHRRQAGPRGVARKNAAERKLPRMEETTHAVPAPPDPAATSPSPRRRPPLPRPRPDRRR